MQCLQVNTVMMDREKKPVKTYGLMICLIIALNVTIPAISKATLLEEPITPIPEEHGQDPARVSLGQQLFNDVRLSKNNILSCASCHQLSQGGDDGLKTSITNNGSPDLINAPTVFNSRFNFRQTWRGKFRNLEQQAEGDLQNPRHGNIGWDELIPKLQNIEYYRKEFKKIYKKGISRESVLELLATYERSLITPGSRFDEYLKGNSKALNKKEKEGYRLFKSHGCIACHQGVNVGGNVYQEFGLFGDYFKKRGNIKKADYGLFNVTGKEGDKFVFRVPGLRNVEVTAPYLHDGTVNDLEEVVKIMAEYQLGTELPEETIKLITAFLKTLTGKYQGKLLQENHNE